MIMLFERPLLLILVLLLPLLAAALVTGSYSRRRKRLARLGSDEIVARLTQGVSGNTRASRVITLSMAAALAGVALAGPRWGTEEARVTGSGIDMVLALDASLSMMATDERPNRLERMKQEIRRLRASSRGDRIGVIAFAGRSYILTPLTTDEGALDLFLENLDPSVVGQAGSSVSRAIRQGTDLLTATESGSDKALIVLSDWESFEPDEDVIAAAARAGQAGISLITVGFGTVDGSRIPVPGNTRTGYKLDEGGSVVVTRYDPDLLRATAEAAGGVYIDASETDKAARIRQAIGTLRTEKRAVQVGRDQSPRFQLFLFPALILVLLDTLLAERRGLVPRNATNKDRKEKPGLMDDRPDREGRSTGSLNSGSTARARATTAAMSLAFAVTWPTVPGLGMTDHAAGHYRAGRYAQAVQEYRRLLDDGDERAQTLYNYGTALLGADSLARAIEVLGRAGQAADEEIRFRSFFNLGLAHLRTGLEGDEGEETERALDAALSAYKSALLMRSSDPDAKWNYELALRKKDDGGGGGGGGEDQQQEPQTSPQDTDSDRQSGGLGTQQAEQILNNAAREESEVQAKAQDRNRPSRPPGGKDW